jgi:hypothetical protein
MDNIKGIKKEVNRQKKIRVKRSKEWDSIKAMKALDNSIAERFLIQSGIDKNEAKCIIQREARFDEELFGMIAKNFIESKKRKTLKSVGL